MRACWLPGLLSLFVAIPLASAQQTIPDAGSLLRQEESARELQPAPLPALPPEAPLPELTDTGAMRVMVQGVRYTGSVDLVGEPALDAVVAEALGRELDFAGLEALAERVTRRLKESGWILARAYLPEQDVSEGLITLAILPGRLDTEGRAFRIESGTGSALRVDPERLGRVLTGLVPQGEPVREADLNRALLLINDLSGIRAAARLEPGETPGSTHVLLVVDEDRRWDTALSASNYGNRSTGRTQGSVSGSLNNLSGVGDQADLAYTLAEGMGFVRFGYRRPLGTQGWLLELGQTALDYEVVSGAGAASAIDGDARVSRLGLSYPLVRSRLANVTLGMEGAYEALEDRVAGTAISDKRVETLSLRLGADRTDRWGGGGRTDLSLVPTWGNLDLSRVPDDARQDAVTFGRAGDFAKLEWRLARLQAIGTSRFTAYAELRGQFANRNLDSSQRLQVAGPGGVRAYPGGEASSDEGQFARLELRYAIPGLAMLPGQLTLAGFYERAHVQRFHNLGAGQIDSATGRNRYHIEGAGVSLTMNQPGRFSAGVTWATTLGDNPGRSVDGNNSDGRDDDQRVWLQTELRL